MFTIPKLRQWDGPFTGELRRVSPLPMLGQLPASSAPQAIVRSICGFCSTGCNLQIHLRDGAAVNVTADGGYPVNQGMACPKGWEALTPLTAPDRATVPLLRTERTGERRPVDWPTAAATFCQRMKEVQHRHGPHSVAFLSTGQIATEEMAFLGAFAKFGMGVRHGDGNTRQCMATAAAAYKESFGFDAPPFTYEDFEESDVLVFVGANPCIAHPILWQRVLNNRRKPEIIVIDPRRTETAMAATWHVALKPKSDLQLFYALARELLHRGAIDEAFLNRHTDGWPDFAAFVEPFTVESTARTTGLSEDDIRRLAGSIQAGKRVSFWWTMGVNQSHQSTRTAQAIINLALLGGHVGKPGTGANSITGQCNAMGSRLFSNTTNLLAGHEFANPAHRAKIAAATGIPEDRIPTQPSWAYDQIIDGISAGDIKALWIVATNPVHSWINHGRLPELLGKLEFLVVQDMYHSTETAVHADLLLPAAGWGEKEGTFINSERRIGVIRQLSQAPGQALSDFRIVRLLASEWGCGGMFWEWTSPAAVFQILKRCARGQPCDISGIRDFSMLEECGGLQWPLTEENAVPQHRRLFEDGRFFTPNGRAIFRFEAPRPMPEETDGGYPLMLLTGRGSSAQWHTETRTRHSAVLRKLHPDKLWLEIHPADASTAGVQDQEPLAVISRRGGVSAVARVSATVQPGQVFLPMHDPTVNQLTLPAVDPHSRQPAYKGCAVRVEKRRVRHDHRVGVSEA